LDDPGKEARFERVAEAVVGQLLRGPPSDLQYAAIARRAGVSRPWLYKYFGPDKEGLVAFTARLFGEAFARLEAFPPSPTVEAFREHLASGTRRGLADALTAPWCVEIYFRYHHAQHVLGQAVRDVEATHVAAFADALPPTLRRDRAAALRFAEVFTATRMAVYFRWLDPAFRQRHSEDAMVREVLRPFDAFARP